MSKLGQPDPFRVILRAYGEEHECELLPSEWSGKSSSWLFSVQSFGFSFKQSLEKLQFVKGDADFIRKQLDKYGISAEVDFLLQKCQDNWTYKDYFTAQIDFGAGYTNDRDFIEVELFEGGLKKSLDSNKGTNYEIGFDANAVDLEVPEGMRLHESVKYDISGKIKTTEASSNHPEIPTNSRWKWLSVIPMVVNSNSFAVTKGIVWGPQEISNIIVDDTTLDRYQDSTPFLKVTDQFSSDNLISVKAKISIKFLDFSNIWNTVRVRIINIKEGVRTPREIGYFTIEKGLVWEKEIIINLNNNDVGGEFKLEILYEWAYKPEIGVKPILIEVEGNVNLEYLGAVNTGSLSMKAYKYADFGNKLLNKIHSGATYKNTILEALEANNAQLFITTSDAIRGLDNALIKTNLSDFTDSFFYLFSSGLKIDNAASVYGVYDKKEILDKNNKLLDLGEVKELQIEKMPDDWLFNVFLYGYEKQEYDYPMGRQGFADTLEYSSELKIQSKKLEAVCKYRADYMGVHLIHYAYLNNEKKDSKSDNDIFVILAFKNATTGKWQAVPGPGVHFGGFEGDGEFNLLLSPHWNLRRNTDYIRSILDKISPVLTYESSTETQSNFVSGYGDVLVIEKSDEDTSSATKLFCPIFVKCTAIVPDNLPELLGENPSGYFEFTWNRQRFKGFPVDVESLAAHESAQQVSMVMHPDMPGDVQFKMFWKDPSKLY